MVLRVLAKNQALYCRYHEYCFSKRYNTKPLPFKKFYPIEDAARLLGVNAYELFKSMITSPTLHAIENEDGIFVHPIELIKRIAEKQQRELARILNQTNRHQKSLKVRD